MLHPRSSQRLRHLGRSVFSAERSSSSLKTRERIQNGGKQPAGLGFGANFAFVLKAVYQARERNCSRKALQFPAMHNGRIVFRCPAEPIKDYLRKGGKIEDTVGARCLCNGLFAADGTRD